MKKIILSIFAMSLLIVSCSSDDDTAGSEPSGAYENGILISSESEDAGSVSFISEDLMTTENQIYFNVNNEVLGVYLQSIGFNGNEAYIITDNANTITIVNRYTFEKTGTITTGLLTPRFISFANGKGYVTNWGDSNDSNDDFIAVVDLSSNTVTSTIPVGNGPEQALTVGNTVYVSHKGGYTTNNIVSVINTLTDVLTTTITVNDNPDEMLVNNSGDLVVLSSGKPAWTGEETIGAITSIDVSTNTVSNILEFADGEHPNFMAYLNGSLYYNVNNAIYSISDTDSVLATTSDFTLSTQTLYGMAANNDRLYFLDAVDYVSQGKLFIYDEATYSLTHSFDVTKLSSKIYFN